LRALALRYTTGRSPAMDTTSLERATLNVITRVRRGKPDPLTSVVLTTPVFLTYHIGILWSTKRNGADWVSDLTLQLLHSSVEAYVIVTLAAALGLVLSVWVLRKTGKVQPTELLPIVVESAAWAFVMLVSIGWAVQRVAPALATPLAYGPIEKVVMAAGAGFHEEVMFRFLMLSGGALVLRRVLSVPPIRAWVAAALVSSVVFAFVHHVGVNGEGITLTALAFRTLAGLFLAVLYGARGFAVAVYTHALYDMLVFFVLS
jgi:hypothetical protein